MLWGSETWWTGACHILNQISPAYKMLAHTITGLPNWTQKPILPGDAGLPPLELLSNRISQSYGIQVIQQKDDDLFKHALLRALGKPGNATGAGLQQITDLLAPLIAGGRSLEETKDSRNNSSAHQSLGQKRKKRRLDKKSG